eukprot:9529358-Prorocentrum_lima.AAC.1
MGIAGRPFHMARRRKLYVFWLSVPPCSQLVVKGKRATYSNYPGSNSPVIWAIVVHSSGVSRNALWSLGL